MFLLALGLACAPTAAEAMARALDPDASLDTALQWCAKAGESSGECSASIVRSRPEATSEACAGIVEEKWHAECQFAAAEHRGKAGDRWGALIGCGQAGSFYNECLYHAWTFDLQAVSNDLGSAVSGVDAARPVIAFWSQIQTIGPDAEDQLWRDWWYFANAHNKPADLAACGRLVDPTDQNRCINGTKAYVRRAVTEEVLRPGTSRELRDRLCRGDATIARTAMGTLYRPDADLDAEATLALTEACGKTQATVSRPWNPIFRDRLSLHLPPMSPSAPSAPPQPSQATTP